MTMQGKPFAIPAAEVAAFASATGDVNPLHVDPGYARRTPFGRPIAHGALAVLHALAALPARRTRPLARLAARFAAPVYPDQEYTVVVTAGGAGRDEIEVLDGSALVLHVEVQTAADGPDTTPAMAPERRRSEPATRTIEDIAVGTRLPVGSPAHPDELGALLDRIGAAKAGVTVRQAAVLGWASYLAGMELPGRDSLISTVEVDFPPPTTSGDGHLGEVTVAGVDARFGLIQLHGELPSGGTVRLRVLVRSTPPAADPHAVRALLPAGEPLAGQVALVIGGSRGLGASVVHGLAQQGATVYLAYRSSAAEAEAVRAALGELADRVRPVSGDAADATWCARLGERILAAHGRLDVLILNAFPPVTALPLDSVTAGRSADYLAAGLSLVRVPLAAFGPSVAESGGKVVAVSSVWVTQPPAGWSHYVSAKLAVEGLIRAAAAELPGAAFLIARPPRMRTAFSSSAFGASDAIPTEPVAAAIVDWTGRPAGTDGAEVLEDFPEPPAHLPAPRGVVAVAGTFTLDPVREELQSIVDGLGLGAGVELAGYGQVFQELLDPASTFGRNTRGCNVVLLRPADWPAQEAERTAADLLAAVETAAGRSRVPLLVVHCPSAEPSPDSVDLFGRLAGIPGVQVWDGVRMTADQFDPARSRLAHIPYTPAGYSLLAAGVARAAHAVLGAPFKVLVLDCDNTLWQGVCGEDGPDGVVLTPAHRRLQEWAADLAGRGVLVCLSSKNDQATVDETFRRHPDFPLRPEHIAARRVDWAPKPAGLAALAAELDVGLDSMVFLDDNPAEIAAVRAALPQVLALRVPDDPGEIPAFLDRVWAFDRLQVTDEDRRRTAFYRSRRDRAELRRGAASFAEFIAGLQLSVDITEATGETLARVAQLTQRTNQFNASGVRRQQPELAALLAGGSAACWVADVRDRFGDYGIVGAAVTRTAGDTVELDTFLMSCRVLGRGVEHRFLAHLGQVAQAAGATMMSILYRPTARNEPVRRFLDTVLAGHSEPGPDGVVAYRVPVERVAAVTFRPEEMEGVDSETPVSAAPPLAVPADHAARLAALARLAYQVGAADAGDPLTAPATKGDRDAVDPDDTGVRRALEIVVDVFSRVLALPAERLTGTVRMDQLRPSSLSLVDATVELERHFGELPATLLFEPWTLHELARHLAGVPDHTPAPAPPPAGPSRIGARQAAPDVDPVAVVGLAGRYPGARTVDELWRLLRDGVDCVGEIPAERWDHGPHYDPDGAPGRSYSRWAGLIDGIDEFDPLFFSISPGEAELMDPQQRLFLQTAYEALADAGYTPAGVGRDVGVYVGAMAHDYGIFSAHAALTGESPYPWAENYQIANRVSYAFDFTGPSLVVDTACSASGSALYLAWEAVRRGEVSAAIAGGVNLVLHPARHIQYAQMGMLSRSGRCRSFGAGADGFVLGEGVGAVVLKRLADARRDGDHVYGVLLGAATNSDGRTNGFTVPNPRAQAELVRKALVVSGVAPSTIGYVEAHGSGTPLGDPIEVRGLTEAFGETGGGSGRCGLGSVKSNLGHLESAAAVAGLTKVLLQLRHRRLVPTLHAAEPNPRLDLAAGPFHLQREYAEWEPAGPRRAGLSSFGAGGVNVHFVLEEAPAAAGSDEPDGEQLFLLSARGGQQLAEYAALLRDRLRRDGAELRMVDVAHTLRVGREALAERAAFRAGSLDELLVALDALAAGATAEGVLRGAGGTLAPPPRLLDDLVTAGDLDTLAWLWVQGGEVPWERLAPAGGRRVSLPPPPFARTRHWLASARPGRSAAVAPATPVVRAVASPEPVTSGAVGYFRPRWRRYAGPPIHYGPAWSAPTVLLLGGGPADPGPPGVRCVEVRSGERYHWDGDSAVVVREGESADLRRLLAELPTGRDIVMIDYRRLQPSDRTDAAAVLTLAMALAHALPGGGPRIDYVLVGPGEADDPAAAAIVGFGRSVEAEGLPLRCTRVETPVGHRPSVAECLSMLAGPEREVRYTRDGWQARGHAPVTAGEPAAVSFRDRGAYLITGGAGGVGRLIARHLAGKYHARLVLLGRSAAGADVERLLQEVRDRGGEASYLAVDVTDRDGLEAALATARERIGALHGVIHAAGLIDDAGIAAKTHASAGRVVAPKVAGTVLLDQATATDALDFFLLMSSYVGTLGSAGQADYAAANRFLDAFAEYRQRLAREGSRLGVTVSVAWPLWTAGGMRMPAEVRELTATTTGLRPIGTADALAALERAIGYGGGTVLVGHGDLARFEASLNGVAAAVSPATAAVALDASAGGVEPVLARALSETLKLPAEELDWDVQFGEYGVNSVLMVRLANRVNELLGVAIGPAVLYDTPTIRSLAGTLRDRYPAAAPTPPAALDKPARTARPREREAIAVVGMAGRFPRSSNLDAFWGHLAAGRDLVGAPPAGRPLIGATVRGGFLDDVEGFDAAFFGISPREAHLMDPQQRLFLEVCWHALEDAGRDPRGLAGSRTGVFAGVTLGDYFELLSRTEAARSGHLATGNVHSIVPNRISYLLDLRGPSEAIDTACASSLTALHRACLALRGGECDLAIAGGVNVLLSSTWFTALSAAGMLSAAGRCGTFDESADGYVRGEGAGAVVLKPLSRAVADGDRIHGLILGSAVNHGGRAHSLTAPRPSGQAEAVLGALRDAGVPANTISYVETHGTGTELGDPIEVAGLREAFTRAGVESVVDAVLPDAAVATGRWALGAVKASIGHLESAAGIAGLITVLLAMRHRTLPGNPHFAKLNPHIDFSGDRFWVVDRPCPWGASPLANGREAPRRAGVSSFGFGGSNAHVIVEEPPIVNGAVGRPAQAHPEQVVVLSARDVARRGEYVRRLLDMLERADTAGPTFLADLAHTARTGRPALAARLAVRCEDVGELRDRLRAHLAGEPVTGVHHGVVKSGATESGDTAAPTDLDSAAARWVAGGQVDRSVWGAGSGRLVDFPLYPFDHSRKFGIPSAHTPSLLTRRWVPARPASLSTPEQLRPGTCVIVLGRESTLPIEAALVGKATGSLVVVREQARLPRLASVPLDTYDLDFTDAVAGRELADALLRQHPDLWAVVDLTDIAGDCPGDPLSGLRDDPGRLGLLQGLLSRRTMGHLRLVHIASSNDRGPASLTGVRIAALLRSLSAEYSGASVSTLDTDLTTAQADEVLALALAELGQQAGIEPEVRVRRGQRHIPVMQRVPVDPPPAMARHFGPHRVDPDGVYLLTGGTGGIGLAVARRLAERGARRFAILSLRPVPPREQWPDPKEPVARTAGADRLAGLVELAGTGAEISFYHGPLTDTAALAGFLERVRDDLGPIRGVLHCAGSVSHETPAFVRKPVPQILQTWQPKGSGLLALHGLLAHDHPDFVVLFSSVCATVPALAVGLSDYASGNAVLDGYAELAGAVAPGTRYLAVDWGSWTGLGMGEVTSPRYRELGFAALTESQGLDLLEAALRQAPETSVVAANVLPDAEHNWHGERPGSIPATAATNRTATDEPASADVSTRSAGLLAAVTARITELLAGELMLSPAEVGARTPFADLGVDSILLASLVGKLEELAGTALRPSVILEYPSVAELAEHLTTEYGPHIEGWLAEDEQPPAEPTAEVPRSTVDSSRESDDRARQPLGMPIAVIGVASRFPGAPDAEAYWALLRDGHCAVREVPPSRWDVDQLYSASRLPGHSTSRWGGFLDGIEDFDPEFFGIAPVDAAHVDPLIRLFLEGVEIAIRDAGYRPEDLARDRVGVFVGSGTSNYGSRINAPTRNTVTGLNQNFIAAQAAQVYDLRGPNFTVDSACSSSLTGVYLALQALRLGECEVAVVGGADLLLDEAPYLKLSASGALSPDGVCHAFDAKANGIVLGEGVGVLLLKPLDRALADGDRVDAVIEAAAINNDGRTMGLTTPNPKAQEQVVRAALDKAGITADQMSYVEAHGTGTMIGDPMELQALTRAYRRDTDQRGFCAVGSVKSNVGHLLMASGMASLHKVVLSLVHGVIPATLHCDEPNPRFAFGASPFFPAVGTHPWQPRQGVRRAGVSAFGFGGTNCHVILRELLDVERERYRPRREPLDPPRFQRARYWMDRMPPATGDPSGAMPARRPLLELHIADLPDHAVPARPRPVLELHEELS
jgi:polyketide synthase PksN